MDIKLFWNDIITQNRGSLSSYFCKDAVIRWHCTNEQFTVEEYVQANCDYPGRWQGDIVLYSGNQIVVFYGSNSWAYTRLGKINLSEAELTELLSNGNVILKLAQ